MRLKTERGTLLLTNVYLPPQQAHADEQGELHTTSNRHRIMQEISAFIKTNQRKNEPIIMSGDMNAAWYPTDRHSTDNFTTDDRAYHEWASTLKLRPVDALYPNKYNRLTTYESRSTKCDNKVTGASSRIDDWLITTPDAQDTREQEYPDPPRPYRNLEHMSDHHPLCLAVHAHNLGIRIDHEWKTNQERKIWNTQRLKRNLTQEEKLSTQATLQVELENKITECTQLVERLETDPTAGPTQIDGIAANIHIILKEALFITLREVGENVAYTGRTAKGQGPKRRQNQEGFLKDTDKRKYRRLIRLQGQLRSALRHRPKSEQPVPKPQIFLEAESDLKTLLAEQNPETTPQDWWEQTAVGLRTAKTQIKTILRRHDGRRARKNQEKFRDTLRNTETGSQIPLRVWGELYTGQCQALHRGSDHK